MSVLSKVYVVVGVICCMISYEPENEEIVKRALCDNKYEVLSETLFQLPGTIRNRIETSNVVAGIFVELIFFVAFIIWMFFLIFPFIVLEGISLYKRGILFQ